MLTNKYLSFHLLIAHGKGVQRLESQHKIFTGCGLSLLGKGSIFNQLQVLLKPEILPSVYFETLPSLTKTVCDSLTDNTHKVNNPNSYYNSTFPAKCLILFISSWIAHLNGHNSLRNLIFVVSPYPTQKDITFDAKCFSHPLAKHIVYISHKCCLVTDSAWDILTSPLLFNCGPRNRYQPFRLPEHLQAASLLFPSPSHPCAAHIAIPRRTKYNSRHLV